MSNPTELPDLLLCPFCGSGNVHMSGNGQSSYVYCPECETEGPPDATPSAATDTWNRRAQPEGEAPQAEPEPNPSLEDCPEDDQHWAKVDPAVAFHLIERHAEDWADAGRMMLQWHKAMSRAAQHAESGAPAPDAARVDAIVTGLYRRFKEWSKRGFGPDDVTWCEVKADVIELIASGGAVLAAQSQGAPALPTARAGDPDVDAAQWAEVFYRNAETFTVRDLGIVRAAWKEATRRAAQLDGGQGEGK